MRQNTYEGIEITEICLSDIDKVDKEGIENSTVLYCL